jgi:hypothetical protein
LVLAATLGTASTLRAATVTAAWNPNPEPDIAGYRLFYGTQSGVYSIIIDVGNVTNWPLTLAGGVTYFFVIEAYDTSGLFSHQSAEVSYAAPMTPSIAGLAPTNGPIGTVVTITGANFGTTQGTSTVTFGGIAATPVSWSATRCLALVPAGATTGNVVVTVGGAASNSVAFTVERPPTLIAPAAQVSGVNTSVSLQVVGNDPDGRTLTYSATNLPPALTINAATGLIAGTLSAASAGAYTVTVNAADGVLSINQTFEWTVYPATMSSTPTSVAPGGTLTVTWEGIATPTATDWFALFPVGAADGGYVTWWLTTDTASDSTLVVLPPSLPAGNYELRLFAQDSFVRLGVGNAFAVTSPGPVLGLSPPQLAPGGTITITWQGVVAPTSTDWVGLFNLNAAGSDPLLWGYTAGAAGGDDIVALPSMPAGVYELGLFAQNSWRRLALSNAFTVGSPGPVLAVDLATVAAGGALTVTWQGVVSPTATHWVALFLVGAADAEYLASWNTTGSSVGSRVITVPASLPPGSYELRLFLQGASQRLARSNAFIVH